MAVRSRVLGCGSYLPSRVVSNAELSALGFGIVHSLAPFMCMYLLWNIETFHRARYAASGKVHSCLDKVGSALLLLSSPRTYQHARAPPLSPGR